MARIFYYVNTGHRVGLDRFRKAAALLEHTEDVDITILTNDFRIASQARQYHMKKAVGIDVIRNIPNIAQQQDVLIYDSNEHNPVLYEDMQSFFNPLIDIDDAIVAVDSVFEKNVEKKNNVVLFFGDDDYEKDLLNLAQQSELDEVEILLGFYYFLEMDELLAPLCKTLHENEEYIDVIKQATLLITASPQAALEGAISGAKVVYMQREDYPQEYKKFLSDLNIYTTDVTVLDKKTIEHYMHTIEPVTLSNEAKSLRETLKMHNLI